MAAPDSGPLVFSVAFHYETRGLLLAFFGWNGATAILGYLPRCDVACLHAADGGNAFFLCGGLIGNDQEEMRSRIRSGCYMDDKGPCAPVDGML